MDISIQILVTTYRLSLVKHLVWWSMIFVEVLLLFQHGDGRHLDCLGHHDLALHHGRDPALSMSQTNFVHVAFSNIGVFVKLDNFYLLHGINLEVLIGNDNLLVEVIDLFLTHLSELFHHVISRDENGIEVLLLGERGSLSLHFGLEIWLAVFSYNESEALKLLLGFIGLDVVWNLQVVNGGLIRSLGMQVPIFSLHHIVKTAFSFPCSLVRLFCLLFNLIFINNWESETEMLGRISVKLAWILCNLLSELLFLELPNVELLISVLKDINAFRNVKPLLEGPSTIH